MACLFISAWDSLLVCGPIQTRRGEGGLVLPGAPTMRHSYRGTSRVAVHFFFYRCGRGLSSVRVTASFRIQSEHLRRGRGRRRKTGFCVCVWGGGGQPRSQKSPLPLHSKDEDAGGRVAVHHRGTISSRQHHGKRRFPDFLASFFFLKQLLRWRLRVETCLSHFLSCYMALLTAVWIGRGCSTLLLFPQCGKTTLHFFARLVFLSFERSLGPRVKKPIKFPWLQVWSKRGAYLTRLCNKRDAASFLFNGFQSCAKRPRDMIFGPF